MEYKYNVGELKAFVLKESSNEFKPVIGDNVESEDKKNNGKAYKDAKKQAKDFDKGGDEYKPKTEKVEPNGDDFNGTTLGVEFDNDPGKDYTDRIKAQGEGFTSTLEKNNNIEKDPSAEFGLKTYNMIKDREEARQKAKADRKGSGLVGAEAEKHDKNIFKKENVFESVKTVQFKKTKFLNEEHMISRIPDELKNEGQVFHMKDNSGNDYLVEWNNGQANVKDYQNKTLVNEQLERMRNLFNYNPNDQRKTSRYQF